jgi:stress response protein SCP2
VYPCNYTVDKHIAKDMLDIDSSTFTIDHHDKISADDMWYQKAYHWDRKSRYWRCQALVDDK